MKERDLKSIYPTWQTYFAWEESLTPLQLLRGDKLGEWPKGTPPALIEIRKRIWGQDRLLEFITGQLPPMEEVMARQLVGEEELAQLKEEPLEGRLREVAEKALSRLTERERIVLLERCGGIDGRIKKQSELARELGYSTRTIRRIEKRAALKIEIIDLPDYQ